MAQWQDEVAEEISGVADQNPYVTRDGGVAALAHVGYRGSPAVLSGGKDIVNGTACASDSPDALTATGTRIHSFRNAGTEKSYVEADGTYVGPETWDDIQGPALGAGGSSALVNEQFGDVSGMILPRFSHNLDRSVSFAFQMPHRYNRGEVRFHAHVVPMGDPAGDEVVKLSGKYAWAKYATTIPANSAWGTFDVSYTVSVGAVMKHAIVPLFTSTPTGAKESDFLLVVLTRAGSSDSADTYTTAAASGTAAANLTLLGADVHFQVNKSGTKAEVPA